MLSVMVVFTALQVHSLVLLAGHQIVNRPSLRPYGWSSATLSGVSSMAYLVLGAISLGMITYLEQALRDAAGERRLRKQTIRSALLLLGIWLVAALIRLAGSRF